MVHLKKDSISIEMYCPNADYESLYNLQVNLITLMQCRDFSLNNGYTDIYYCLDLLKATLIEPEQMEGVNLT